MIWKLKRDKTTKPPEILKPTASETPDLKIETERVKEKPITPPQKSKPSSDKKKTKYSPEKLIKLRSEFMIKFHVLKLNLCLL